MPHSYQCPRCHRNWTDDAARDLCPRCLLEIALDPRAIEEDEPGLLATLASQSGGEPVPRLGAERSRNSEPGDRQTGTYFSSGAGVAASRADNDPRGGRTTDPATGIQRTQTDSLASSTPMRMLPTIAGYEILSELGRTRMSVVYLARQVRLNRLCALKMILGGDHASPEAILRSLVEAEAVARFQHPNIVRIHQTGETGGLPFLELEYVSGGSLDRQLDGTPWPPLRAARLVETLSHGMSVAHRAGIVHRDLKPANVLLDDDGTPKITDFGLAKVLQSDSGLTQSDAIMGTPSYMAPEQAEGKTKDIDALADIYALGAILYELITGRPPFRGESILKTLEQVKSKEPVPPSQLQPGLPRDLETIALKCLAKDPAKRYATAQELADDLRRFLDNKEIRARRSGSIERFGRFVKHHPAETGLAVAAFVTLLLAILLGTGIAYEQRLVGALAEADRLRALAQKEKKGAELERARSKKGFDRIRAVVENFLDLIEKRLDEPKLKPLRDELLAQCLSVYQKVLKEYADSPELQLELIRTYTGAAKVAASLGSTGEALKIYEQALAMLDQLIAANPTAWHFQVELAEVHHRLGSLHLAAGRCDTALREFARGRVLREGLRVRQPGEPRILTDLARSHGFIGDLLLQTGRLSDAGRSYGESHEIRTRLADADPTNTALQFQLARSFENLGRLAGLLGRYDEAGDSWRRALAIQKDLDAGAPALREFRGDKAETQCEYGKILLESRQTVAGLNALKEAADLYRALVRDSPSVPSFQSGLGTCHLALSAARRELGLTGEALVSCRIARDAFKSLSDDNVSVTEYRYYLGLCWDEQSKLEERAGDYAAALVSSTQARDLLQGLVTSDPQNFDYRSALGMAWTNLGVVLNRLGKGTEAVVALGYAIAEQTRTTTKASEARRYQDRLAAAQTILDNLKAEAHGGLRSN